MFAVGCLLCGPQAAPGAGVTVLTHGLADNTDGWIAGMTSAVTNYVAAQGMRCSVYELDVTWSPPFSTVLFSVSAARVGGTAPTATDSGQIVVKLNWHDLAGSADGVVGVWAPSTYDVAAAATAALLRTNLLPELAGHALVELPIHLIGHDRGGSLVCQISQLLGTNGVWVDHLTTLDPHPFNNDGFEDYSFAFIDAPARTYANVYFHDNYWQSDFDPKGESVMGSYSRKLSSLSGGYAGTNGAHSDVHLWYHGTIDLHTPTTDRGGGLLTAAERAAWWIAYEQAGARAGFYYGLIGGGNRLSPSQPVWTATNAIKDGVNQLWDFGAGISSNRVALEANSGQWPNAITFNRLDTNAAIQGQSLSLRLYWQWAQPLANSGTIAFYLDDDQNPLNANQTLQQDWSFPGTGSIVYHADASFVLEATRAAPGWHWLFVKISGGGRTRYLYAPERVLVVRDPATCAFALSPEAATYSASGGTGGFSVVTSNGCAWAAVANGTWLHTTSSGTTGGVVNYTVDANAGAASRFGSITVGNHAFTLAQAGTACSYWLSASGVALPAGGAATNFTVEAGAGCPWAASSTNAWIHTASSDTGNGTLTFTVDANPVTSQRLGSISVQDAVFTVLQDGAPCTCVLLPRTFTHGASAGSGSFRVTSPGACPWTASTAADWLHITAGFSGLGNGNVAYHVAANASARARTGTIALGGQTFTVTQLGDAQSPTLKVTRPLAGQRLSNSVFTAQGTAVDNVAVAAVWFQWNTNDWTTASGTTNWSAPVTLTPGTNWLRACALDVAGNASATNRVSCIYVVSGPLTLQTVGKGTLSPNYSNAVLEIGRTYTLTAVPGTGLVFSNWTAGLGGPVVTNKPTLKFVMQSNLVWAANFTDVQRPLVTITSPKSGIRVSNAVVTVTGTASDNAAVSHVWLVVNGAPLLTTGTTLWSNRVSLIPGTNTVRAYSVDRTGNRSLTNSLTCYYVVTGSLSLWTNGVGTITRSFAGNTLEIGQNYTVTAVPGAGQVFSNWSGTLPVATAQLAFRMQSNLVLQANFVPNPFLALQGNYNGLFSPTSVASAGTSGATNCGYLTLNLTGLGGFSGSLRLEGVTLPVGGSFSLQLQAQTTAPRVGKPAVGLSLQLERPAAGPLIRGSVAGGSLWESPLLAYRAGSSRSNAYAGTYTLLLAGGDAYGLCFLPTNAPWGDSPAGVKVSALGAIQMGGTLADGQVLSQSTAVGEAGDWPVYVSLYGGRGFLIGWLSLAAHQTAGSLYWLMPAAWPGSGYPSGIGQYRQAFLARYAPPAAGQNPVAWTNADVILSGGDVPGRLTNRVVLANSKFTSLPGGSISNLILTLTSANGLFKGSFVHPVTRKVTAINGALQPGVSGPWPPAGGGWFLGPTQDGLLCLHPQ